MPLIYEYKCRKCGHIMVETQTGLNVNCPLCEGSMGRKYSVHTTASFQPHYNIALGRWVNTHNEFRDGLQAKSDEMSARTGIDHNYVPIDMADSAAFGATDEGMESFHREHHDNPITESII